MDTAYRYYPETVNGDVNGDFAYAAQLGAERQTFITAQIEAGCFTPQGLQERGLPAPNLTK